MTLLLMQADRAAAPDLNSVASQWAACLGVGSVDPQDLLNTIDGTAAARSPYGEAGAACLTEPIRAEAVRLRAQHHLRIAADNEEIVQAWAALVDKESLAATAAGG